jgi:hypothetical protein
MLLPWGQITHRNLCFNYTCKFGVISIKYVITSIIYRLMHALFHIKTVIVPRDRYRPEGFSPRVDIGQGMITVLIWKKACINLFITSFNIELKRTPEVPQRYLPSGQNSDNTISSLSGAPWRHFRPTVNCRLENVDVQRGNICWRFGSRYRSLISISLVSVWEVNFVLFNSMLKYVINRLMRRHFPNDNWQLSGSDVMGPQRGLISCYQSFVPMADIAVALPVFTYGQNWRYYL